MEYRTRESAEKTQGGKQISHGTEPAAYGGEAPALEARSVSFSYDGRREVLSRLSLKIPRGRVTVLLGANGCGKTTLFRLLSKNLYPDAGELFLAGENIEELSRREYAKRAAIVHQNNTAPPDLRVETLVGYGRTPYLRAFQTADGRRDREAVEWALRVTGVERHRRERVAELSGGQRQRVWIAAALAQQTDILMLDEPTSFLDVRYQLEVLRLIRILNREFKITVVMVLHDINQALRYGDGIVGMRDGRITAQGSPEEVVTEAFLRELYGVALPLTEIGGRKYALTV